MFALHIKYLKYLSYSNVEYYYMYVLYIHIYKTKLSMCVKSTIKEILPKMPRVITDE